MSDTSAGVTASFGVFSSITIPLSENYYSAEFPLSLVPTSLLETPLLDLFSKLVIGTILVAFGVKIELSLCSSCEEMRLLV